jgi:hypothetical protein
LLGQVSCSTWLLKEAAKSDYGGEGKKKVNIHFYDAKEGKGDERKP